MLPSLVFPKFISYQESLKIESDVICDTGYYSILSKILMGYNNDLLYQYFSTAVPESVLHFRLDVFKDIDMNTKLFTSLQDFISGIESAVNYEEYAININNRVQKSKWHLDAVVTYCSSVEHLYECLKNCNLISETLVNLREFLSSYIESVDFSLCCTTARRNNGRSWKD
jgi:hypothetical protein